MASTCISMTYPGTSRDTKNTMYNCSALTTAGAPCAAAHGARRAVLAPPALASFKTSTASPFGHGVAGCSKRLRY